MSGSRVFLSYAKEDVEAAQRLAGWLEDGGFTPFWFQSPDRPGERFIVELEEKIAEADYFLVLLSPDYLASRWCEREREYALQRENDLGHPVIRVLDVRPVPAGSGGFLAPYSRIPLRSLTADALPGEIAVALGLPRAARDDRQLSTVFRNRNDEIAKVANALELSSGQDFWVVVSPPRLGKSRFLRHIHDRLASGGANVRLVDLANEPGDLWSDAPKVIARLLDVEVDASTERLGDEQVRRIARNVLDRGRQFYFLDSADRLDRATALEVRRVLSDLHRRLWGNGGAQARFGVVVGTRQHDDWRGFDATRSRVEPVFLSEFTAEIVEQAVRQYQPQWTSQNTRACAELLHRMSEGLPALLTRWLDWAEDKQFFELAEEAEEDEAFDTVVRPYVVSDLLRPEVLFTRRHAYAARYAEVIRRAVRSLAVYRLFTRSHLLFHYDRDARLPHLAADVGWTFAELWDAVTKITLLVSDDGREMWREISPPIRRLLYAYYYRADADRVRAHREARAFYERWVGKDASQEMGVMMVECLWHETSRRLLEERSTIPAELPALAGGLARDFLNSNMYSPDEFAWFVARRLGKDHEFQLALSGFGTVFDAVLASIEASLSEGG
ncbi:TIR domain-containing protein [Actinosynnema sp. NPDC053489]|uniref:TIR domain-containing protein n=1 Tax=Actinosynnema sp. NPDC053489 TaxID=3363916 RepID=UPI0037CBD571